MRDFQELAKQIDAYEFGTVFTLSVTPEGFVLAERHDVSVPEVYHDEDEDVIVWSSDWEALKGFTGQHGYRGAVNHPSEFIGSGIAEELARLSEDEPQSFAVVPVEVDSPEDEDPAGWAILHYTKTDEPFEMCVTCGVKPWGHGYCGEQCEKCAASPDE